MRLPVHRLGTKANPLDLGDAKVWHLPQWSTTSHEGRLKIIRQIAMMRGRDPKIAQLAVKIIKDSGAKPREYKEQAAALLAWIQDPKNVYYVNEPGERLQDPLYTIKVGHGDCDDMVSLLCALFESVGMPWRLVISANTPTGKIRHIEGQPIQHGVNWAHIYCMVGTPSFSPTKWYFCETTLGKMPLGWDIVDGDPRFMPELGGKPGEIPMIMSSPAYGNAYSSSSIGGSIAGSVAGSMEDGQIKWKQVAQAIVTGVTVAVTTQLVLDWVRGQGMWSRR